MTIARQAFEVEQFKAEFALEDEFPRNPAATNKRYQPVLCLHGLGCVKSYPKLGQSLGLSSEDTEQILTGNARRLLNLR